MLDFNRFFALACGFVLTLASSPAAQGQNAPLVKQWDRCLGGARQDEPTSIWPTADGGYIVAGYSDSGIGTDKSQASRGFYDYWVIKLDAQGQKQWDRTFGGADDDQLSSVEQTPDGGYILGGISNSGLNGDKTQAARGLHDYWVIKLDAQGTKVWDRTLGSTSDETGGRVRVMADGGYIVGGYSDGRATGDRSQASFGLLDYWIVKLDAQGNKQWDKAFGGTDNDYLLDLRATADGGCVLGGATYSPVSGEVSEASRGLADYWVLKLNAQGGKVWDHRFGSTGQDRLLALKPTPDGGYILGGESNSGVGGERSQPSWGSYDYWALKITALGAKVWDRRFGGSDQDYLRSLELAPGGGYLLAGISYPPADGDRTEAPRGSSDFWTVRIDSQGALLWERRFGSIGVDYFNSLCATSDGGFLLAGSSSGPASGDKTAVGPGAIGYLDFWLVKLGTSVSAAQQATDAATLHAYPNPARTSVEVPAYVPGVAAELRLHDLTGRCVRRMAISGSESRIILPTVGLVPGMYTLQWRSANTVATQRLVVE